MDTKGWRSARIVCSLSMALALCAGCESAPFVGVDRAPLGRVPLAGPCSPLPAGVRLDFPHQARSEYVYRTPQGLRRLLLLQVDRISAAQARQRLDLQLVARGFTEVTSDDAAGVPQEPGWKFFERRGYGLIGRRVDPIPGVSTDDLVRATLQLDVPRRVLRPRGNPCPSLPRTSPPPALVNR